MAMAGDGSAAWMDDVKMRDGPLAASIVPTTFCAMRSDPATLVASVRSMTSRPTSVHEDAATCW